MRFTRVTRIVSDCDLAHDAPSSVQILAAGSLSLWRLASSTLIDSIDLELTPTDKCRFEHPPDRGLSNGNRFAALDSGPVPRNSNYQNAGDRGNQGSYQGSYQGGGEYYTLWVTKVNLSDHWSSASSSQTRPYMLDRDTIVTDLSTERPQWILSAYGPGRQAPAQLFGGPLREKSFEEMRLLHYFGQASGNAQQAVGNCPG